jgi:hypothetical protein
MKGLIHRAHYFCDQEADLKKELALLENVFIANGYPEKLVTQTIKESWPIEITKKLQRLAGEKEDKKNDKYFDVLNVPYIAGFTEGLQKKLAKFQIGVTPKKGITLYHHLCKLKPPIRAEDTKNVVYAIPCASCGKLYVGETAQKFSERRKQHNNDIKYQKPTNAFFCHLRDHPDHSIEWNHFTFLARENGAIGRKLTESIFINALNPSEEMQHILNLEKGLEIDKCWHYFNEEVKKEAKIDHSFEFVRDGGLFSEDAEAIEILFDR